MPSSELIVLMLGERDRSTFTPSPVLSTFLSTLPSFACFSRRRIFSSSFSCVAFSLLAFFCRSFMDDVLIVSMPSPSLDTILFRLPFSSDCFSCGELQ